LQTEKTEKNLKNLKNPVCDEKTLPIGYTNRVIGGSASLSGKRVSD